MDNNGKIFVGLYPTDAGSQLLLLAFNLKYSTSITRQQNLGQNLKLLKFEQEKNTRLRIRGNKFHGGLNVDSLDALKQYFDPEMAIKA